MTQTRWVLEVLVAWLDPVIGDPLVPLSESHSQLASGEVAAQASVYATAERDVPVLLTVQADLGAIAEGTWVDVGRPVADHDRGPLGDALAVG